jgi:hypothetical protein
LDEPIQKFARSLPFWRPLIWSALKTFWCQEFLENCKLIFLCCLHHGCKKYQLHSVSLYQSSSKHSRIQGFAWMYLELKSWELEVAPFAHGAGEALKAVLVLVLLAVASGRCRANGFDWSLEAVAEKICCLFWWTFKFCRW